MSEKLNINVRSEIGELEGVILHTPGKEVENMNPRNASKALYSDILNLAIVNQEYAQLSGVLNKITRTFQIKDLLAEVLKNDKVKNDLIHNVVRNENLQDIMDDLESFNPYELSTAMLEGLLMEKNNLTRFLDKRRYSLVPLHNFFFTRDASVSVLDKVLISKMASPVRERESLIMETIFDYHPDFVTTTFNPICDRAPKDEISIEGGDVLIARDDILLIGTGTRTSSRGIDALIEKYKKEGGIKHIIVQQLPHEPESFIHLDMVFTLLDKDKCMVFEPLIMHSNKYLTLHIEILNEKDVKIRGEKNILEALKKLGMDLKPVYCGGTEDLYNMEREQWHSGANFFALAPGKVIGYGRNSYTIEEMNRNGFEVIKALDVISESINLADYNQYVVTIEGSELSRGGGGCRCMTMPVRRKAVEW
ncbi:MAG: arginine deiminase [Bacteroidales bacterium]|nr:arginine deiminase [Bacteroidales bacterium]